MIKAAKYLALAIILYLLIDILVSADTGAREKELGKQRSGRHIEDRLLRNEREKERVPHLDRAPSIFAP